LQTQDLPAQKPSFPVTGRDFPPRSGRFFSD
jgi:hypothetical protein